MCQIFFCYVVIDSIKNDRVQLLFLTLVEVDMKETVLYLKKAFTPTRMLIKTNVYSLR